MRKYNIAPEALRAEANPVEHKRQLTSHQQTGLRRLLRMLNAALERLGDSEQSETSLSPTWLTNKRRAQLAFINGHRGAGKTTLMTTLVRLVVPERDSRFFENFNKPDPQTVPSESSSGLEDELVDLAQPLRGRVVVLEPLDMEPLPKETPLLAAILARLSGAARDCGTTGAQSRGLLDPDLADDRDFIRFQQFQSQIARALDSNLPSRRGNLDREQYGRAVMEQEDDRLRIRYSLDIVLKHLSKAIEAEGSQSPTSHEGSPKHLFLVPVDDVDLNPTRCLELLRLLRSYSPPQLFFLLMGQFDLVKTIVKMSMASEYARLRVAQMPTSRTAEERLERDLAEVAAANLQKMVPDVIELPSLAINEIMAFRPLGTSPDAKPLGDLFAEVKFTNESVLPVGVCNLRDLLKFNRRSVSPGIARTTPDFKIGEYPGLGAFQVSPRRLVDLWRHLSEALEREQQAVESDAGDVDPVVQVFENHWTRIVDEDPYLDAESRERLQREGIDGCEVILGTENAITRELPIEDATVEIHEGDRDDGASYQPLLSIASATLESGIPRLRLCRQPVSDLHSEETQQELLDLRTRCAYVLLHDLRLARGAPQTVNRSERLRVASPVAMLWKNEGGVPVRINWPLPRLNSFAEFTALLGSLDSEFTAMQYDESEELRSLPQQLLKRMMRVWVMRGLHSLLRRPQNAVTHYSSWSDIIQWLAEQTNLASPSDEQLVWLMQVAMMTMPEASAIGPAADSRQLDQLSKEQLTTIAKLDHLAKNNLRELKGRRSRQLDVLWRDEFRDLWHYLNDQVNNDSWLNLRLRSPMHRKSDDFTSAFKEFRGEIGKQLRETELRLAMDTETTQVRALIRQGQSLLDTNAQSAHSLLSQGIELAESLAEQHPDDSKLTFLLVDAAEGLGAANLSLLAPAESSDRYSQAIEAISRLINESPDPDIHNQRRINLMISLANTQVFSRDLQGALETIEAAIQSCDVCLKSRPDDPAWQRLLANCRIWQGVTYRELGQRADAAQHLRNALDILAPIDGPQKTGDLGGIDFARAKRYLATVLWQNGNLKAAHNFAEEAYLFASSQASRQTEGSGVQQLHLHASELLGRLSLDLLQKDRAIELLRESLEIAERRDSRDLTALIRSQDLARSRTQLARAYRIAKRQKEALDLLRLAHPVLNRIATLDRLGRQSASDLGTVCLELARVHWDLKHRREAAHYLEAAEESLTQALEIESYKGPILLKFWELKWMKFETSPAGQKTKELWKGVQEYFKEVLDKDVYVNPELEEMSKQRDEIATAPKRRGKQ